MTPESMDASRNDFLPPPRIWACNAAYVSFTTHITRSKATPFSPGSDSRAHFAMRGRVSLSLRARVLAQLPARISCSWHADELFAGGQAGKVANCLHQLDWR